MGCDLDASAERQPNQIGDWRAFAGGEARLSLRDGTQGKVLGTTKRERGSGTYPMAQQTDTAVRLRRACVWSSVAATVRMSFSTAMLQCRILCRLEKQAGRRLRGLTEPGECAQPAMQSGRGGSLFVDGVARASRSRTACAHQECWGGGGGGGGALRGAAAWAGRRATGQGRTGPGRTGRELPGLCCNSNAAKCRCLPADGGRGGSAGGQSRCAVARGRVVEISGDAHGRRRAARPDQRQSKINSGLVGRVSKRIRGGGRLAHHAWAER